ncbi:hypothetical protein [Rhodoferax sp.]|uniref:hypothetical protein n=1 Tax=Rhodoferax sp. TaxID=50421 RepID=UPI00374D646D
MAENENTAQIANKISAEIFKVFHWELYAQNNANFKCELEHHKNENGKSKLTHPGDVVFYYFDPYLNKTIYLHTDLKSYKKTTIQAKKIREALTSLAMTVECAHLSNGWSDKFMAQDGHPYEVRGLLFVANHDNKATAKFGEYLQGISIANLPIAKGQIVHVLGPLEISTLFSVATDIKLSIQDKTISSHYRFHYPDLTLWKRHTPDDQRNGATIEMLLAPYFILKHHAVCDDKGVEVTRPGSVVYYARTGDTVEEFVYLIDCLSRYQLVNSKEQIKIKSFNRNRSSELKNNFDKAKRRYCDMWRFDGDREAEVMGIPVDGIQQIVPNYVPDEIGWKE